MIKNITFKAILSLTVLFVAMFLIGRLTSESRAQEAGHIHLIIENAEGVILFDDMLSYETDDAFIDILKRHFEVTCANGAYQPDPTCSFSFVLGPQVQGSSIREDQVILGIQGDDFELMTNWTDDFLAFEMLVDNAYVLTTQGPSNLPFEDGQTFRIKVKNTQNTWNEGS